MKNNILISTDDIELPFSTENIKFFLDMLLEKRNHVGWEVSILFCSDDSMRQYNNTYRHIDSSTDILSFQSGDMYIDEEKNEWYTAGDIAISLATMYRNCEEFNVTANEELKRLLIHGILHLEGMDHGDAHITAQAHITADTTGTDTNDDMLEMQESIVKDVSDFILIKGKK
ncbi:MAG: rRNA maturation RNase YbeY [Treponema sp. CETP13]|nr:MAG: rRNA maturation RNase YbeY [Treponema sp. CETP13]